jgi:MFS family permease
MSVPLIGRVKINLDSHTIRHYAWVIVAIGAAAQMLGSAIRMAFGIVIDPLAEEFGWSPGSIGYTYALMSIVTALFSPIAGWMGSRFGARSTMAVGIVLFLAGMLWVSQTRQLWELYVAYGIVFGVAQALFLVPVVPAVANWFRRHLGLGTGLLLISWSLGPALVIQMLGFLIEQVGWSTTFAITGIAGSIGMGSLLLFFRDSPEQAGKRPYGWEPGDRPMLTKGAVFNQKSREFQGRIQRTNAFWNLINIHFLGCVGHAVILVGLVPMMTHRGIPYGTAVTALALVSVISLATRGITPMLADKFGSKPVMFWSFLGQGAGVLILLTANTPAEFFLFVAVWSLPYGGEGTAFPVINRQYYGHVPMGPTYGWQLLGAGLGMALGGALPGMVFDITGAYTWAIVLAAAFSLAGAVIILVLEPTRRPLIPEWQPGEPEPEVGSRLAETAPAGAAD